MKRFNVRLLYTYKFIGQCLPIYAFYTLLFVERGIALGEVALLIALWSAFAILFEVPSGILADRWNRRNMLVISSGLQGVCFVIWAFSHNFILFAVGFIFWGLSGAFVSGTEESLIYDNLKSDGFEESFAKVYGKAQFFANTGTIAGIASAGIMASFISIGAISLLSAAICFLNAGIVSHLREKNYYAERQKNESSGFLTTLREAGAFLKGSTVAFVTVLFLVLFANLGSYLDEFDALIINDFRIGSIWVIVILTVRFIFVSLGDIVAPFIQKRTLSIRQIFLINGLACVSLAVFAIIWSGYAILLFGLFSMFTAVTEILLVDTMQSEIREEGRSTVMSFYGAGQNVAMICFSLIYALLSGIFTLQQTYVIISVYGIIGGVSFFLYEKK